MEEDSIILEKFIKSAPKAKELKRALAVKFVKLGNPYSQIKNLLNVSKGFITKGRHIYEAKGIEALKVGYKLNVSSRHLFKAVTFLKRLQSRFPNQQIVLFWDGATYHKYGLTQDYLKELNQGLAEDDWRITCCVLAPYAPEQNPVEDVWLWGKRWVQKHYYQCQSFADVKRLFVEAIDGHVFNFNKLQQYFCSQPI